MTNFKVGDTVVVKKGVKDPDFGTDLGGWYGRIAAVNPEDKNNIEVNWDSITLKNMSQDIIAACVIEQLDFGSMLLAANELKPAQPRDTVREAEEMLTRLTVQNMLSIDDDENDDLALDFFAPLAAQMAGGALDWDEGDEFEEEVIFDLEEFFALLEIPTNEQALVTQCLAIGLYNYYFNVYGYEKYGSNLDWLIPERMYEPYIFGYGTTEILNNKKISTETKHKIIAYTLGTTSPAEEYGIPYGLINILQYLAENEHLDTSIFNLIMVTLQANPRGSFDDFTGVGWIAVSKWVISCPDISADETIWWIWQFSTYFDGNLNPAQGKKVFQYWMDHKGLTPDAKRELCWNWLTESKDIGSKPIAWQLMEAQINGDIKGVKKLLQALGAPPADIADAIRNMEQIQAEFSGPISDLGFVYGFPDFILLPTWLKRSAVFQLAKLGEDPLEICGLFLDQSRDYDSESINKGVADILRHYGEQFLPDQLRALIEKGLSIPQVQTRKTFYQLSTQFYGNEYMPNTQTDNAASIRKWGKKQLQ